LGRTHRLIMFNFFKGKPFGLVITDDTLQVIQLEERKKKLHIKAIGEKKLQKGIVKNGKIFQEKILGTLITQLLASTIPSPIRQKQCIVVLPETQSYEHIFYLPTDLKGTALEKMIEKKAATAIPLNFVETKYNYKVYRLFKTQVVFMVAVNRIILASYYQVLKIFCDLQPMILEPASLSLLRNIPLNFKPNQGLILIHAEAQEINWFLFWQGLIFDSNSISNKQFKTEPQALKEDLKKSMLFFEENTGQKITAITLSGQQGITQVLEAELKNAFEASINKSSHHRVELAGSEIPEGFEVVLGAALKPFIKETSIPINLLKQ
jgi:Tfp pilus assembly PilM family ATPase